MKISSTRENLVKGIQVVQSAIASKAGALPVLQNFLAETDKDNLKIVATDLEMAIKHSIKVDVKSDGSVTIPMKKFMEVIQNLDKEDINITVDDSSKILVNSGKTKVKIGGLPKSDYPLIPDIDEKESFKVKALEIADMIEKTVFSAASEDERKFLNGLFWKNEKGVFSIVATDGRRLALYQKENFKIKKDFKVIIPTKIMNELLKFIRSGEYQEKDEILVSISTNQVCFKIGETVFISRLIEGNFPSYEQIIPKKTEATLTVNTQKLLASTKRAAICSNDRAGNVKYTIKKNVMIVSASSQIMEFEDEFEVDFDGQEMQISYNPKFIIDILKAVDSENIIFKFTGANTPTLIKIPDNEDLLYIVMPLRAQ